MQSALDEISAGVSKCSLFPICIGVTLRFKTSSVEPASAFRQIVEVLFALSPNAVLDVICAGLSVLWLDVICARVSS